SAAPGPGPAAAGPAARSTAGRQDHAERVLACNPLKTWKPPETGAFCWNTREDRTFAVAFKPFVSFVPQFPMHVEPSDIKVRIIRQRFCRASTGVATITE